MDTTERFSVRVSALVQGRLTLTGAETPRAVPRASSYSKMCPAARGSFLHFVARNLNCVSPQTQKGRPNEATAHSDIQVVREASRADAFSCM